MRLCASGPIPTFNSLYDGVRSKLTFPPSSFTVPRLPGLPNPMFPGINAPNLALVQIVQQVQQYQLLVTFQAFLQPLVKFLGLGLEDVLPKIPGTNLNLLNLLALNPNALYNQLAALSPSALASLPGVPNPLSFGVNIPSVTVTIAIQGVINGYMNSLVGIITKLISSVTDKLQISGLPAIPSVPSIQNLMQYAIPPGLPVPDVSKMLSKYSLNYMMSKIAVPGFPSMPPLPDPLIPSINDPELNFFIGINLTYSNLVMYPMTIILNFIQKTLGKFISFTFPTVCVSI